MKEHPILFQTEMIRAILDGRKVMTRRIIKNFDIKINEFGKIDYSGKTRFGHNCDLESINDKFLGIVDKCPYGTVGDVLWLRETWNERNGEYAYKASLDLFKQTNWYKEIKKTFDIYNAPLEDNCIKWRPSIFMPRAASRITLKITNIKVERVQDISEEDAIKEGVQPTSYCAGCGRISGNCDCPAGTITEKAVPLFKSLWIKINGQESWDSNPWVWCVSFEKL